MLIGVLSDTHKNLRLVRRVFDIFKSEGVDYVFHLGDVSSDMDNLDIEYDIPIAMVAGNMDYYGNNPYERVVELGGIRFLLTHGHTLDVRYTLSYLAEAAREKDCSFALYGHTHMGKLTNIDGIVILNPGSISEPRGNSQRSFAFIHVEESSAQVEFRYL